MKHLVIYIYIIVFCFSCQDYLETAPDSSLDVLIDSEEKIAELLTGAYPKASYFSFLEARTDNVAKRENGVNLSLNEAMYSWGDYDQEDLDTPLFYWNACYAGIAQANKALELLATYPKTERVRALYGEAFLLRAYLHFMIVNIWSEPYKGEQSKKDMGIPYVTSSEKQAFVKYSRGNVFEVYEKIEKDLKLGITLVNTNFYTKPKYHFNKEAAYAFASRFYLFKADWEKVIAYSNYILAGSAKQKLKDWRAYRKIYAFSNPELLYQSYASKTEPSNLLLATTESRLARELPYQLYGFSQKLYKKLGLGYYVFSSSNVPVYDGLYMAKFDEFSLYADLEEVYPKDIYVTNVLFSTDEVVLNKMEAQVMLKQYDNAIVNYLDYQKIKFDRALSADEKSALLSTDDRNYELYNPFYGLTIKQLAFVQQLIKERRQEFLHEAMRWFDIRRFYIPVNRTSLPLRREDPRKVLQLPIAAIQQGLPANPR